MAPTDLEQLERMLADERPVLDPAAAKRIDERVDTVRSRRRLPGLSWPNTRQLSLAGAAATVLVGLVVGVSTLGDDDPVTMDGGRQDGQAMTTGAPATGAGEAEQAPAPAQLEEPVKSAADAPVQSDSDAAIAPGSGGGGAAGPGIAADAARQGGYAGPSSKAAPDVLADPTGTAVSPIPPIPGGDGLATGQDERVVERNASMTISGEPDEVRSIADEIIAITDRAGGIVISANVEERPNQPRSSTASLELAIPADRLDQALADFSETGSVEARNQSDLDVTSEAVSVRTRLRNARETRNALRERLDDATESSEIEELRLQIERAERRVASRKADAKRLANRTQYARVFVGVVANGHGEADEDDGGWSLGDAWDDAVDVLRTMAGVALITAAIIIPLGVLVTLIYILVTRRRRAARESALDTE